MSTNYTNIQQFLVKSLTDKNIIIFLNKWFKKNSFFQFFAKVFREQFNFTYT